MSNQISVVQAQVMASKEQFKRLSTTLEFAKEASFAMQQIESNDYLYKIAEQNPQSLRKAMFNVANIGLSLNPALRNAYLIPRKGEICLDISYRGLVALATESGAIEWCQANLVYEKDTFSISGYDTYPTHTFDPFDTERGEIKGVYCVTKLKNGILVTTLNMQELDEIRSSSQAAEKPGSIWKVWFGEMAKKSVIKRAAKMWPTAKTLHEAIHMLDVVNGEGMTSTQAEKPAEKVINQPEPSVEASKPAMSKARIDTLIAKAISGNNQSKAVEYFKTQLANDSEKLEYALNALSA